MALNGNTDWRSPGQILNRRLEAAGWSVIRVWEHEDPVEAADEIERVVRELDS